jgi:hypothetical protein
LGAEYGYLNWTVEKEPAAVELDDNHVKTVGPGRSHRLLAVSLLREQGIEFPQLLQVLCRIKGLIKKIRGSGAKSGTFWPGLNIPFLHNNL